MLVLVSAVPAGDFAASMQREWALRQAQRECCFLYTKSDGTSFRGFPLAQDHNRIHLMTKTGIVILSPDDLRIAPIQSLVNSRQ